MLALGPPEDLDPSCVSQGLVPPWPEAASQAAGHGERVWRQKAGLCSQQGEDGRKGQERSTGSSGWHSERAGVASLRLQPPGLGPGPWVFLCRSDCELEASGSAGAPETVTSPLSPNPGPGPRALWSRHSVPGWAAPLLIFVCRPGRRRAGGQLFSTIPKIVGQGQGTKSHLHRSSRHSLPFTKGTEPAAGAQGCRQASLGPASSSSCRVTLNARCPPATRGAPDTSHWVMQRTGVFPPQGLGPGELRLAGPGTCAQRWPDRLPAQLPSVIKFRSQKATRVCTVLSARIRGPLALPPPRPCQQLTAGLSGGGIPRPGLWLPVRVPTPREIR